MQALQLPQYPLKMKAVNDQKFIFDRIRKKYVVLTPEEWVRQNFISHLIEGMNYPESLIANEIEITLYGLSRRCDSVVYSRSGKPVMIIEFKAPKIPISQKVFEQIAAYNLQLKVNFLIISNGLKHYCIQLDEKTGKASVLKNIPSHNDL